MKHFSKNKGFVNKLRVAALSVLLLTPMLVGVLTTVLPAPVAYAARKPSPDGVPHAEITLTSTSSGVKYTLSGVLNGQSISFTNPSTNVFLSGKLPGAGQDCANETAKQYNQFTVKVTASGKTVGSTSMDFCGAGSNIITKTIAVTTPSAAVQPASVYGSVSYKDSDGKTKPIKKEATGKLTGGPDNQTYQLRFNDSGKIVNTTQLDNLKPGNYKISVDYVVPGDSNQNYTKSFTLKAGEHKDISGALAGNVRNPGNGQDPNGTASTDNNDLSCDTKFDNPLTWIICPVTKVLVEVIGALDRLINTELFIDANGIFCTTGDTTANCTGFYNAWKGFRDIALGIMLIAGLVVLIAQSLGMEVLDAYTIRKVLPRLLIVAVAITLSWTLMNFAVGLSNDLGYSIGHLLRAPFDNLKDELDLSFGDGVTGSFFGSLAAGGAAVGGIALWIPLGGIGVMLSFAGTAALAVLVAVLTLILRQIFIIMMILIAPVAIVMYILPNTQRVYKMWWESFFKALLMFPMIVAFIATGKIFSAIALNTHNGGPINQVIGFVAYFAPYFMIPLTFKFAGGAMSQVGNAVNHQAQGGFKKLKESRQKSRADRIKAAQTGGLYQRKFGAFSVKRPFARNADGTRKQWSSSADQVLNKLGNYTTDGGDSWRVLAGKSGGPVGRALFGRKSRDLQRQIENQEIAHTEEAAKSLHERYHAGRAVAGALDYYYDELDENAQSALRNNFGIGKRTKNEDTGQMELLEENRTGWRGSENETEHLQMASIFDHGGQGAREAAEELRAEAITLDTFGGPGKDDTQRTDQRFLGMLVAASAGRLENHELAAYYNEMAESGDGEKAYLRLKKLQQAAEGKRTSQKEGYGIEFEVVARADGSTYKRARDVYEHPVSAQAQKSVGRISSQDIANSKAEDLVDPDGALSGYAQSLIASASLEEVREEVYQHRSARTGKLVDKVRVVSTGKPKEGKALLDAQAQRGELATLHTYNYGDRGVGSAVRELMDGANIHTEEHNQTREEAEARAAARAKADARAGSTTEEEIPPEPGAVNPQKPEPPAP